VSAIIPLAGSGRDFWDDISYRGPQVYTACVRKMDALRNVISTIHRFPLSCIVDVFINLKL